MAVAEVFHATVLNLHQPSGNLEHLLANREWEAREILYAYDRIYRALRDYEDVGRVHLSLSGTLLETLANPDFQSRVYGIVKCGDLLWNLRQPSIDILGTGYYHPVFPLTPRADWPEHLTRWIGLGRHLFARPTFSGFWPPEMGFCMEMIPALKKAGYRYVIVDSEHIEPVTKMRWEELRYRPHIASYEGAEIIVVVRDRELSNAQEAGMELGWFANEVSERTKWCSEPALVTTCTDGENGGWFRNTTMNANFWGAFYLPMMEAVRHRQLTFRPAFIHDYLDQYGASGEVKVREGAWNTGWHHGCDFQQWRGSFVQQDALARVQNVSKMVNDTLAGYKGRPDLPDEVRRCLTEAQWHLLRAETSCNFFWGTDWVHQAHQDLNTSLQWLDNAKRV